jgi:hypothetical protein
MDQSGRANFRVVWRKLESCRASSRESSYYHQLKSRWKKPGRSGLGAAEDDDVAGGGGRPFRVTDRLKELPEKL